MFSDPSGGTIDERLWAEDVVVETPFAPPGRPRRFEGREAFLAFAAKERPEAPPRLRRRAVQVYETGNPGLVVVEYELGGTPPGGGGEMWAPFIAVLRARDGEITHWREYQDPIVMAAATGRLPALLRSLGAGQPTGN